MSRINGPELEIPPLNERQADKICIAVSLLATRFSTVEIIPSALLKFVASIEYKYNVRSLTHVIDFIDGTDHKAKKLPLKAVKLPLGDTTQYHNSPLARQVYHSEGPGDLVRLWKEASDNTFDVRIANNEMAVMMANALRTP